MNYTVMAARMPAAGKVFLAIFTLVFMPSGLASESSFFECIQTIPDRTGCKIRENNLMGLTSVEAFEQDFLVNYNFQCVGHREPLMVESDSQSVELVRNSGASFLNIRGSTVLHVRALNERNFYRSSFNTACDLTVYSITASPSSNTLMLWNSKAEDLAKILKLSREFFEITLSMDAYQNYNSVKFALLKSKLELLLENDPDNIDYKVLLITVNAGLSGSVIPYNPEEIRSAGGALSAWSRNELIKNRDEALKLISQFEKYRQIVNEQLKKALLEVGQP